jgi:hypothetical protein
MPSSRVRCETLNAITPHNPTLASKSASPANAPSRTLLGAVPRDSPNVFFHRRDRCHRLIRIERLYSLYRGREQKRIARLHFDQQSVSLPEDIAQRKKTSAGNAALDIFLPGALVSRARNDSDDRRRRSILIQGLIIVHVLPDRSTFGK